MASRFGNPNSGRRIYAIDELTSRKSTTELNETLDKLEKKSYSSDPDAKRYDEVSIDEVIEKNLQVVDMTASILARDNKMPMWVFGLNEENSIVNTVKGNFNGTKVLV